MTAHVWYALVSLLPAVGGLLAYPRRPGGAALALAVSLGGGGALVAWSAPGETVAAAACAFWGAAGCGFVLLACLRGRHDDGVQEAELGAARSQRQDVARMLAESKSAGHETELEQKETFALYGMIKSLAEALSWDDIRPKLESAVGQYMGVTEFALYAAIQGGKEGFQALTVRGLPKNSAGASWSTWERSLQEQGRTVAESLVVASPEKAVALPIHDGTEYLGYFYARIPAGVDPGPLLEKARTFASDIAFAFRRVQLFQEVERLSQIDGLTGVYRRGTFDERLRDEVMRAKTFKTTFGLMLLDIDHFKSLNDRYGHPFGDQVLKRMGELLNASVYETDFVARYGGEEFVVLLPRADPEGALRKAETIRRAVEAEKFPLAFETIHVTVSIGIAHFPRDAGGPEELVARADGAMYQAKSQGRNRVVACPDLRRAS